MVRKQVLKDGQAVEQAAGQMGHGQMLKKCWLNDWLFHPYNYET